MTDMTWERRTEPFEDVLGKYQMIRAIELCKGPNVLDIGCGDGIITKELCKYFEHVVGIDISKEQIELAQRNAPLATFYISSIEEFDIHNRFDNIHFDSVLMFNILEHVDNPISVLTKVKNFINENGYIVIQVPNALSLNRRIGKIMGLIKQYYELTTYDIKIGHKRLYDLNLLKRDILLSGLKIKECGGIIIKPLSNPQMEWLINSELWNSGNRGWGDTSISSVSWNERYCNALYDIGKDLPEYCTILYAQCTC